MHPLTNIKLRGYRKRHAASTLRAFHSPLVKSTLPSNPLRIVCISDTHNSRLTLPPGDVLIHAGDLTENGSFDEMQAELNWLSDQPHAYKILIAGNHDVLLDEAFLAKYPERRYGQTKTRDDLKWGTVIYLQDSFITLDFPSTKSGDHEPRKLTIFGSPWTPRYGTSAFQYHPNDESHWSSRFASLDTEPDIIITHCPPKHHLDTRDFHRAGCPYLAEEVARICPRLIVFGHIHASYGREDVVLDGVQRAYEEIMTGWAGWMTVSWMAILVLWGRLARLVLPWRFGKEKTVFINAAVVSGRDNTLTNAPIVVEL